MSSLVGGNSVNGDHRNASFVGGTDKRCSGILSRNFPMNCIPAGPNRYKIFFSIVDRPASRQHFGSLEKGRDELVFFRPAYNEHQRGKLSGCVPFHDFRSPTVNILVTVQELFRDLLPSLFRRPHHKKETMS